MNPPGYHGKRGRTWCITMPARPCPASSSRHSAGVRTLSNASTSARPRALFRARPYPITRTRRSTAPAGERQNAFAHTSASTILPPGRSTRTISDTRPGTSMWWVPRAQSATSKLPPAHGIASADAHTRRVRARCPAAASFASPRTSIAGVMSSP